MLYVPQLTDKEIKENHKRYSERILLYKNRGLDFIESRKLILKKAGPLKGKILEIGTGKGYISLALAKAGYKFTSIDIDKEELKTAALNLAYENLLSSITFYIMNGESLSFRDKTFSNVICVGLFHHIDKIDKMLSEIDRVLHVNGKAALGDFNKKGLEIISAVHREEGNTHGDSGVTVDQVHSYFRKLRYEIKNYEDNCHWALILTKKK